MPDLLPACHVLLILEQIGDENYEPSTDTLDELFGADGTGISKGTDWGTGSFRYGKRVPFLLRFLCKGRMV